MENKKYKYYYQVGEYIELNALPQGGFYLSISDSCKLFGISVEVFEDEFNAFYGQSNLNSASMISDTHQFSSDESDSESDPVLYTIDIKTISPEFYESIATKYNRDAYNIFKTWFNMILLEKSLEINSLNGEDNQTYLMIKHMNKQNEILSANHGVCITAKEYLTMIKSFNDSYCAVIDLFRSMLTNRVITDEQIDFFKSINLSYYSFDLTHENNLQAGSDIKKHLFGDTIRPLIAKLEEFYNIEDLTCFFDKVSDDLIVVVYNYNLHPKFLVEFIREFSFNCSVILKEYASYFVKRLYTFENEFWFEDFYLQSEDFTTLTEKIQHFEKGIIEAEKWMLLDSTHNTDRQEADFYIGKCKKAIEIINSEYKVLSNNTSYTEESDKTISHGETDITLNRQFLALYYLLNEVDNKVFSRNKSEIARFIQLLTNKSYDNIYKLTKNPVKDPLERTSKKYQSDIQFVKEAFLKLGLDKIAHQIESDNLVG